MKEELSSFEDELQSKPFFTLKEFAELCGRSVRWAYDRVYSGDLQVMEKGGTSAISSAEIRRFLSKEGPYRGKRPTPMRRAKATSSGAKHPVPPKNSPLIDEEALASWCQSVPNHSGR